MFVMRSRPWKTVLFAASVIGNCAFSACGVMSRMHSRTCKFCVGNMGEGLYEKRRTIKVILQNLSLNLLVQARFVVPAPRLLSHSAWLRYAYNCRPQTKRPSFEFVRQRLRREQPPGWRNLHPCRQETRVRRSRIGTC